MVRMKGADYSTARPALDTLKADGIQFVCAYLTGVEADGSVYCSPAQAYLGGRTEKHFFANREAASIEPIAGGYRITDAAGEKYDFPTPLSREPSTGRKSAILVGAGPSRPGPRPPESEGDSTWNSA